MSFRIEVEDAGDSFPCESGQTVLSATRRAAKSAIAVGCRGGGCGVCKVRVLSGPFETGQMSGAQICAQERLDGIVLACQLYPRGDLKVRTISSRPRFTIGFIP